MFKPAVDNEIVNPKINVKDIGLVNFTTSKNVIVKSTVFSHRNIYKYT